jgi:sugar lactone lactonase YvrE
LRAESGPTQEQRKFQLADAVSNAVAVGPDETTLYVSTAMNHLFVVDRQQANEVARLAH